MTLLTQNSELRPDHIWNWTLPAWVTTLPDGRTVTLEASTRRHRTINP